MLSHTRKVPEKPRGPFFELARGSSVLFSFARFMELAGPQFSHPAHVLFFFGPMHFGTWFGKGQIPVNQFTEYAFEQSFTFSIKRLAMISHRDAKRLILFLHQGGYFSDGWFSLFF